MVGDVRVGYDVTASTLAFPKQAPAVLVGQRHAAEMASVHTRNAVVARELLVDKRVVRREQLGDAAIRLQLIVEKQLRLSHECRSQVVVEPREPRVRIGRQQPDVARLQPLAEEVVDQRSARARIGEHASHLLIEHAGLAQLARDREVEQLVVRNAAPQEERQTRGELDVGETIRGSGSDFAGIGLDAEQKIRADQQTLERRADAVVEISARRTLIEAHQRLDIVCRRGRRYAAAPGSTEFFVAHAVSSLAFAGWQTNMRRAARRVFRHASVVRSANQQRRDREFGAVTSPSRFQIGTRAGPSPSALMPSVLTMVATTCVKAGRHRHAHLQHLIGIVSQARRGDTSRHGELSDARAIDSDLDAGLARSSLESHRHTSSTAGL